MRLEKLEPCPFCGGEVTIADFEIYWSIIASGNEPNVSCGCRLFMESELFDKNDILAKQRAKEKLIEKWNTRKGEGQMTNRDILDELRLKGELVERLKRIAPRFREIINLRYGLSFETGLIVRGEMTLEQVAKLYSITNERVRQIESRVFKELSKGLTDSPWHTGTPTEEGWYLIAFNYEFEEGVRYTTDYFKDGKWAFPMVRDISKLRAWQRIEE